MRRALIASALALVCACSSRPGGGALDVANGDTAGGGDAIAASDAAATPDAPDLDATSDGRGEIDAEQPDDTGDELDAPFTPDGDPLDSAGPDAGDARPDAPDVVDTSLDAEDPPIDTEDGTDDVADTPTDGEDDASDGGETSGDTEVDIDDSDAETDVEEDADDTADGDTGDDTADGDTGDGDGDTADGDGGTDDDASTDPITVPPQTLPVVDLAFEALDSARLPGAQYTPTETAEGARCGEAVLLTGGAAIEDFDGDGLLDIFVATLDGPDRLFRNLGDLRFEDVAEARGVTGTDDDGLSNGGAWVDVDEDGEFELYVTRLYGPSRLYDLQPDGTFIDVASDYALDRTMDLDDSGCQRTFGVTFTDLNQDGALDALLARWGTRAEDGATKILLRSDAGFRTVSPSNGFITPPRSVIFGLPVFDFTGDGLPDIYAVADFNRSQVFEQSAGSFVETTESSGGATEENGMGHALADIDQDGDLDLFVTSIYGGDSVNCALTWGCSGNRMFINQSNGRFVDATSAFGVREGGWGWGPAFGDLDNDGDQDLLMTNGYQIPWSDPSLDVFRASSAPYNNDRNRLWRNDGILPFTDVSSESGFDDPGNGRAVIPFDADRDGDLDLLVSRNIGEVALYINVTPDVYRGMSLRFALPPGLHSGLDGTVKVQITSDSTPVQYAIEPYTPFSSSGPYEVHVGLGAHEGPVATIELILPSGTRYLWSDVMPSALVTLSADDATAPSRD